MSKDTFAEQLEYLRKKVNQAPQSPGVYLHKDAEGKILYVGKAKNLQNRLRSYFIGIERHTPKTRALVAKIFDFDVIVVDNENESLLLENNIIKHNKPPYNILLRDDKTYPYLKITLDEAWPRLVLTRRRKDDGGLYFGPYTNGGELHNLLAVVNRFFNLVKCTPTVFKTVTRPCNYYDIKRCLGPCKLEVDKADYTKQVQSVAGILQGKTSDVCGQLKKEMQAAARDMEFERAARLRDQVKALEGLSGQQSVTLRPGVDVDIAGVYWHSDAASFYVSIVRDGRLVAADSYVIERLHDEVDDLPRDSREEVAREAVFTTFLCQYYQRREVPKYVCVPYAKAGFSAETRSLMVDYLKSMRAQRGNSESVRLEWDCAWPKEELTQTKQDKILKDNFAALCTMTDENARARFQESLKVDEKSQTMLMGLQGFLGLAKIPTWIECFDISTFQGAETVASQVVFKNGKPEKSQYRKYIIKDVVGQDDFASMREVIRRRFKDEKRNERPDLLLIDGGEPQVREVGFVLKSLGLQDLCFVGIAKARSARNFQSSSLAGGNVERLVVPVRHAGDLDSAMACETKILKVGAPEFRLVTQLRDEAHRFAITFHRSRRDKVTVRSVLQSVAGLGPKRKKSLLEAYASFADMHQATAEDIAKKAKIPVDVAHRVKEAAATIAKSDENKK